MTSDVAKGSPTADPVICEALDRASEAEAAGDDVAALHILRSVRYQGPGPSIVKSSSGRILFRIPTEILVLKAREALLSLRMGQWGDSPRHGSTSDTPHGFVTMYEQLNPTLPESNRELRLWMDRLRIVIALEHDHWADAAAWALDLYNLCCENEWTHWGVEALGNMAVAMSHLGYAATAESLYRQILGDEGLAPDSRAAILIRFGDFLWNIGNESEAEDHYAEAIAIYRRLSPPRLNDLHNQVRALQRRADCYIRRGAFDLALRDVDAAFRRVDQSRVLGGYQSYRSVDAPIRTDIRHLLHMYHRIKACDDGDVVGAFCRIANSSAAATVRISRPSRSTPKGGYAPESRPDIATRFKLTSGWAPIDEEDVKGLIQATDTIMMIATTETTTAAMCGITIVCGGGLAPRVHRWTLQDSARRTLDELLTPPPGADHDVGGAWARPWTAPQLGELAEAVLPSGELAVRLSRASEPGLRIMPHGAFWRFPFAALPVNGTPLGQTIPYVLTSGPTQNLRRPELAQWAGHFDLSLPSAMYELLEVLATIRRARVPFRLFGTEAELGELAASDDRVSHLLFAGHGTMGRGQQQLLLANGRRCSASDLAFFASGASIILNGCWSGTVVDTIGSDPADLALSLVADGAHSVLGTVGPVSDRHAAAFLATCVSALIEGAPVAVSMHRAIGQLLGKEPDLPLRAWACYATIGRAIDFAGS